MLLERWLWAGAGGEADDKQDEEDDGDAEQAAFRAVDATREQGAAGGVGLSGWISKRVSGGTASRVEDLEYHGLKALIIGLEAYAKQNGIALERAAVAG